MPVVGLLQELIQNRCVNDGTRDSGHEHRSVATLTDFFGERGEVFEPSPGRQSVIYRVPGTEPGAPHLLLLPHLDVVPANPGGWSVDPFKAEISDGFVWGRGAVDMLNVTAAMAVAFRRYLSGELPPLPGDLILAAVADEEASGTLGARYLVEEHWEKVATTYLLTEVAYPDVVTPGGALHLVAAGEKGPFWTKLRTRGVPGHGSMPYRAENALEPMVAALHGLFSTPAPVSITPEWIDFVESLGLGPGTTESLEDPERVDGGIEDLGATDPALAAYAYAATHLTLSPNLLDAGVKANVIPERAEATVDIRALPGMDRTTINDHLRKAMGDAGAMVEIEPMADHPANVSPTLNPLWEAIVDSVESLAGHRRVLPMLMPVATDARFFRARGVVAYGTGWFDERVPFPEFLKLFHGHDERVSIESLVRTERMLASVIGRFGELTAARG
jgi:acetylornithine deacetylase/succinyl-diaminopimelate desuccinylase-like protein